MIHLNLATAVRLVREAVVEKGEDFVYLQYSGGDGGPACRYAITAEDGDAVPDCIVGHVFHKLGLPMENFVYTFGSANQYSTGGAIRVLRDLNADGKINATPEAANFLSDLQSAQDRGMPWGESLAEALRVNEIE